MRKPFLVSGMRNALIALGSLSSMFVLASEGICQDLPPYRGKVQINWDKKDKPLTNKDVLAMLSSGLSPEIVVAKIRSSACDFDTSPTALEDLKAASVPDAVMLAMLESSGRAKANKSVSLATTSAGQEKSQEKSDAKDVKPQAAQEDLPHDSGVYYKSAASWVPLEVLHYSGIKTKGVAGSMLSAGIGTIGSVLTYRDAHAPLQIADPKPVFCIVGGPPSHRDLLLLRMEEKKDHRELQYSRTSLYSGVKWEYRAEDLQEVVVTRVSDDAVLVTPKTALRHGEYLLIPGFPFGLPSPNAWAGYDFGITSAR